ncbi:hypothetical protein F511_16338 [Dorcoceras hygrometricum]|uniref:Uncharacterized protein n=1 Tax=Dorcoceras hygrometricum TaxID=472368 RepID=A0A2Z7AFW7_9LAMI|nr:hypothetical protein F511_16338 [Dorcoceras hygrometricum]
MHENKATTEGKEPKDLKNSSTTESNQLEDSGHGDSERIDLKPGKPNTSNDPDLASPKTMSHHYPRRTSNTRNQIARDHQISLPNLNKTNQNCSALKSDHFPVGNLQQNQSCSKTYTNPITTPSIPAQIWLNPDLFTPNLVYAKPD